MRGVVPLDGGNEELTRYSAGQSVTMSAHSPGKKSPRYRFDGTLVDSNDAHAASWAAVLHDHGYEVAIDRVRRLMGWAAIG